MGPLGGQAQRAGSPEPARAEDQGWPSGEREPVVHGAYLSDLNSRIMKVAFQKA